MKKYSSKHLLMGVRLVMRDIFRCRSAQAAYVGANPQQFGVMPQWY